MHIRSLKLQIYSFIAVLLVVLLVMLNFYPLVSSRDLVFEEKRSSMASQAAVIAASLSNLDRLSENGISEVLRLLDIRGYQRTVVVNEDGTILYDDNGNTGMMTDLAELRQALGGKTVFRSDFSERAFASSYALPLASQGVMTGALYLYEYDSDRAELILDVQAQIRTVSIIICAASLLIAVIFSRTLLHRISELVRSMRVVASGDYKYRHILRGHDEITELGNEFNMLTERLDDNEKQRRRFVSDASHELKTPLASIRLLSDSIVQNENIDSETMREFVTDIGHEAERLQRTTEKLLDLSRLDDQVQVVPTPVDLKQVSLDALAVLAPLAKEKGIILKSELIDGCVVMATTDDIFHIIFNLLENAVKYNTPGGSVAFRLEEDEDYVRITVADTGIGIPEGERLNIFSRFYRIDKARSREAGGSGLGLSIVHDAVQLHGGSIAVGENKPQGSVFIVTFPRPSAEETGI